MPFTSKIGLDVDAFSSSEDLNTASYDDAGGEQDIYVDADITRRIIHGIWFDMTNMTQNATFRLYYKVDGSNYRRLLSETWNTTQDPACYFGIDLAVTDDFKITLEESSDTGDDIDIPYMAVIEIVEPE